MICQLNRLEARIKEHPWFRHAIQHPLSLIYIAVVVTVSLVLQVLQIVMHALP